MKNIIYLLLVFALLFSGCKDKQEIIPSGKTVKIGVLAPLSGKYKRFGHQSLLGLNAALKMNKYLSNGDEIVLEVIDTKSEINTLKHDIIKLKVSEVIATFSFMNTTNILSLKNEFRNNRLPAIATLATDDHIATNNDYIAQVCMDNHIQVLSAAHFVRDEKLIQNVGIVYDKSSIYSTSIANEFKKYFISLGGKIDFFIDFSSKDGIKKFKNLNNIKTELLFNATNAIISTKLLKRVKKQHLKFEVLGTDGLLSSALEVSKKDLKLFEGIYVIDHYSHNTQTNDNRDIFESILDKDGYKESSYAFLAYDGYQLLVSALESCPEYKATCINNNMKNSKVIQGIASNFVIIDSKSKREIYINKIKNSKLEKEVIIY